MGVGRVHCMHSRQHLLPVADQPTGMRRWRSTLFSTAACCAPLSHSAAAGQHATMSLAALFAALSHAAEFTRDVAAATWGFLPPQLVRPSHCPVHLQHAVSRCCTTR